MRVGIALTLLLLLVACASTPETEDVVAVDEVLDEVSMQDIDESMAGDPMFAGLSRSMRFQLLVWRKTKLEGANIIMTLEMQKNTRRRIDWILDQLDLFKKPGGRTAEDLRENLVVELRKETARLKMIEGHMPAAGLPINEQQKLDVWRRSALANADPISLSEMERTSSRRIRWLEDKIQELKNHRDDVVWDSYLHYRLLLRFEEYKLGHIQERLGKSGGPDEQSAVLGRSAPALRG
ncbi:MAG: hypothetical protein ACYTAF_01940 [Planctomycetota bacterium]|jgi:hypothetical protein